MANFTTIEAESRECAGKGAARATRRAGKVPAVIYGAKQPATLIALDPRQVLRELHKSGWRSRLYEISVDGTISRALIRDVQFHKVSDKPIHVDFQRFAPGQKVHVTVAVNFTNDLTSVGLKRGGVLNVVRHTVEVFCDPEQIPERFEADLGPLDINDNVRWSDLKGTEGTRPSIGDRDFVIATVAAPTKIEVTAAEAAAAAAGPSPAKGKAPQKAPPKAAAPTKAAPKAAAPKKK